MEKNYVYLSTLTENNYFQLFKLDSNKLREIIVDHSEMMIKWEND